MKRWLILLYAGLSFNLWAVPNRPRTLYVENSLARTLSMMTLDDGMITQNIIELGQVPNQILGYREKLFALNTVPPEVMVINGRDLRVEKRIALPEGSNPYAMALAGSQCLLVTLLTADAVAVVNLANGTVDKRIAVGAAPQGIFVDRGYALVANTGGWPDYQKSSLSIVDLVEEVEIQRLAMPANPQVVVAGPDGRYYVLCSGAWGADAGCLAVIDPGDLSSGATATLVDTMTVGGYPGDLVVLPDGVAWMSDWGDMENGFLYRLDIFSGRIDASAANPIRVGRGAMRFLWDKKNADLYVSNFDDDTVQKISPDDGRVLTTLPMGDGAQGMEILEEIAAADPWADAVTDFTPGDAWDQSGYEFFPDNVLGPPDPDRAIDACHPASSPQEVLSFGRGGAITLKFSDNRITDGPGGDFIIFSNAVAGKNSVGPLYRAATVAVSQDGENFYTFPWDAASLGGLAGVTPVRSTSQPTDPVVSGGDLYDLSTVGLKWARYVRITDLGDRWQEGPGLNDFGLDAVAAVHSAFDETDPPQPAAVTFYNYPNPFNQGTTLRFALEEPAPVSLRIYSSIGRLVRRLDFGVLSEGVQTITWDGRGEQGGRSGSGIYFAELCFGGQKRILKMTVLN